jgi:phenylacetate-CoA ligase
LGQKKQDAMSFFRIRTLPGYDWPPLADAAISQVWVAYQELARTEWLDAAEIEERQLEQVRELLAHCIVNVPYYREVFPRAGITPGAIQTLADFRRLPLLPRRTYQERGASFEAVRLPAGTVATNTSQTSGSSGTPTSVLQTNLVHLWWCAFFLRDLEWAGIDPRGSLAAIRSTGQKGPALQRLLQGVSEPSWLPVLNSLIETGPSHVMNIGQDHRVQLQWLRRVAPDYLLSYPGNLEVLGRLAVQEGRISSLKAILSISDTLTEEARKTIETAFGVPVKNTYSCAEAGYLASPCPEGHGFHVHAENVLLEVLDDQGQPCVPGQTGQVYVTHLHNYRGPFMRYKLGDEATVGPASCPCGRGLPLLERVQGKNSPMFHLPNGRRKSSVILARLVRKLGGHWQHQIVQQSAADVVARVVPDAAWTEKHAEDLRHIVAEFFEGPIRVALEVHERLKVPASGKFQSMVNELESVAR